MFIEITKIKMTCSLAGSQTSNKRKEMKKEEKGKLKTYEPVHVTYLYCYMKQQKCERQPYISRRSLPNSLIV